MKNENFFMYFYMYELELLLNSRKEDLLTISFQSDEANTDRPLKEFLKKIIMEELHSLPSVPAISALRINNKLYPVDPYLKFSINRVLLPDEISDELKCKLKNLKNAVYTNPDICFEIQCDDYIYYETIELKSTKSDSIPGSSIQQVIPSEWVIFIKHNKNITEVTTGQYINSVNSKLQFPDRSPRPQVSFKELLSWNDSYRHISNNILVYKPDNSTLIKKDLMSDWQNFLSKRWVDILFNNDSIRRNEPWFNNNLRKFILFFLDKYDTLSDEEKLQFKNKIKRLIKKETD